MSLGAGVPARLGGSSNQNKQERIMKLMKYFVAALAFVAAVGCTHEPDVALVESKAPQIAAHNDVVVNNLTQTEQFSLTWSSARLGEGSLYTVWASDGGEFVELATTSECNYTTTNIDILEQFGITKMGEYSFDFKVVALSADGITLESDVITIVFDYNKISFLYILGAYQGWAENSASSRLLQGEDGIFRGFLHDTTGGGFKICTQNNWGGTNYGWAEEAISNDGGAGNITLAKGLYYIEFDEENMELLTIPVTSVSLIGEGVGDWSTDVVMAYDETSKSWKGIANVTAEKEYKVRFNNAWNVEVDGTQYDFSLGGDAADLAFKGSNLTTGEEGGITGFTLSIFDYPYNIKTGTIEEDAEKLYVVTSYPEWNYLTAPAMQGIYHTEKVMEGDKEKDKTIFDNAFWGLTALPLDAQEPKVVLSRMQTDLATRYAGDAAAMTAYAGGEEVTPMATSAGITIYHADMAEEAMKMRQVAVEKVSIVGAFNDWNVGDTTVEFSPVTAGQTDKWTLTHTFESDGEFKIAFDHMWNTMVDDVQMQTTLGGSCTDLRIGGGNMVMTAGEHTLELNLGTTPMTLAIDGKIADLSLAPELLELTGSFAHYNWNNGDASPQLLNIDGSNVNKFEGIVDMYKPEGSEATDAEFKITYLNWSSWFGGATSSEASPYVFALGGSDANMKIPFGLYYWTVNWNATAKSGEATALAIESVNLIGNVEGTVWSQDFALEAQGAGIYSGEYSINGEFKVRFHEANFTDDTAWKYSIGNNGTADIAVGEATACRCNGGNFNVAEGRYLVEVNLAVTPATITLTAR